MAKQKRDVEIKVLDAILLDDGTIKLAFNHKFRPKVGEVIVMPEVLFELAKRYGEIPRPDETDFPEVPIIELDPVLNAIMGDGVDEEEEGD